MCRAVFKSDGTADSKEEIDGRKYVEVAIASDDLPYSLVFEMPFIFSVFLHQAHSPVRKQFPFQFD